MAKDDGRNLKLDKQGLEELRYIQQVYQNQYSMTGTSINIVLQELQELNSVQKTLENMELTEDKDVLTSIGAEFFVFGKVPDHKKILVSVGANYVVEKDLDGAKAHASALVQKRTDNLTRLTKNRKEIEAALIEVSYRIENSR